VSLDLLEDITRLIREGRLGHAYLLNGDPLEEGRRFAEDLAVKVFTVGTDASEAKVRHRIEARLHPDVHWVEPRGKLRQIKVEEVSGALKRIHEKSFEGGWKVVVFLGAERVNPSSGNKLLKSLEEPPPDTLILLVSSSPEQLLPTLRSRCQFLAVPKGEMGDAVWLDPLLDLMRQGPPRSLRARLDRAAAFRDFFETAAREQMAREDEASGADEEVVDGDVENARETAVRRQLQRKVMAAVEAWYRDVMVCKNGGGADALRYPQAAEAARAQADSLPMKSILKIMENIRKASRRLDGNLPVQVVLESAVF